MSSRVSGFGRPAAPSEMPPLQSIEAPGPATGAEQNGESRSQKPKTLPCKYCSKRFRRVEHVQRHERTHTKEKPFACNWARCGKTFGRRDLLVRHEKLVHLNEGSKEGARHRKPSSGNAVASDSGPSPESRVESEMLSLQPRPPPPPQYTTESVQPSIVTALQQDQHLAPRTPKLNNLDLLSDAATHLASAGEVGQIPSVMLPCLPTPSSSNLSRVKTYDDSMSYDRGGEQDLPVDPGSYPGQPQPASFDDYSLFLDDYATPSHFLPPSLEADQAFAVWPRGGGDLGNRGPSKPSSRFPSRFPSLQPDLRDNPDGGPRAPEDGVRVPTWRTTSQDHAVIKNRLDEFSSVLPTDFIFPSRHTLTRFLEGYISGFHEHLPFLHIPTLIPSEMSPELLLAILAVGAQYRFETHRAYALWYAAKAVALEQIRRRHSHEVHNLLPTPAAYSPHSTRPSPSSGLRHSFTSVHQDRPLTQDTHREPYSPNTPQSRLETIQALLLLFAVGLWGAKAILHEGLSLQSQLALLVREEGLVATPNQAVEWETWVRNEGSARTKLIAYCFFNLCSIAYNTTPLLLTSEIHLYLPHPSRLWKAETAWQWQEARASIANYEIGFQDAFTRLLHRPSSGHITPITSLGNYVLIHSLIQHIFLLKQTSFASIPFGIHRTLRAEDVDEIGTALRTWTYGFEQHRSYRAGDMGQQTAGNDFSGGPIAFNSAALLRLAYIRLYTDLSSRRSLETRDHALIASTFFDAPPLVRTHRLNRAVLQAIHSLSMLVKMGVNYVARTKSLEWSMQYSLSNLECAVLLSKWLLTLASNPTEPPLTDDEKTLLENVRRMLDETEFAVPIDPSLSGGGPTSAPASHLAARSQEIPITEGAKLRQLAAAVVRLWAVTFKEAHHFEVVRIMGAGLDEYAALVDKNRDRTLLGRTGGGSGLG